MQLFRKIFISIKTCPHTNLRFEGEMGEKWVKWVKWVKLSWDTHGHRARQRELGCRTRLPDTTAGHDRRTRLPDTEQYLLRLVLARAARADVHDLLGEHGRSETPGLANSPGMHAAQRRTRGARADVHALLGERGRLETPGFANSPGTRRTRRRARLPQRARPLR